MKNKKQQKETLKEEMVQIDLLMIILVLMFAIVTIFLIVYISNDALDGYEKESNYTRGFEDGQKNLALNIIVTKSIPIMDERLGNTTLFEWIPVVNICEDYCKAKQEAMK